MSRPTDGHIERRERVWLAVQGVLFFALFYLILWRALLTANRGEPLYCDVYARSEEGRWQQFQRITNTIAREDIDPYLLYRKDPAFTQHVERDEP